jgi:hypothetical protein
MELNHRIKNNFQIIISLMSLKKRQLPPDRQEDIRFLQEHVRAMAMAYRLVYDVGNVGEVSAGSLVKEMVAELRHIAKLDASAITFDGTEIRNTMGLDQAIALSLYLAVTLPPYMDRARRSGGRVLITATVADDLLTLSIAGSWAEAIEVDELRSRLTDGYVRQLEAMSLPGSDPSDIRFRFPLGRGGPFGPFNRTAPLPQ